MIVMLLARGDRLPTGWVVSVEHDVAKVTVELDDGRIWVYDSWDDHTHLNWWIGSSEGATHNTRQGPFETQAEAEQYRLRNRCKGQVFPLPMAHHRQRS